MSKRTTKRKATTTVRTSRPSVKLLKAHLALVQDVAADRFEKLQEQGKLLESLQRIIDANKVTIATQDRMIGQYQKAVGRIALECQGTHNDIDALSTEVFKLMDQADREKRRSDVIVWDHILRRVRDADGRVPSPYRILNKVMQEDAGGGEKVKGCGDQCSPLPKPGTDNAAALLGV